MKYLASPLLGIQNDMIYFQQRALCFSLIIGSIVTATVVPEDSNLEPSLTSDAKKQSKRGTDDSRQQNNNLNSGIITAA